MSVLDEIEAGLERDASIMLRHLVYSRKLEPDSEGWALCVLDSRFPRDSTYARKLVAKRYAQFRDRLMTETDLHPQRAMRDPSSGTAAPERRAGLTRDESGLSRHG